MEEPKQEGAMIANDIELENVEGECRMCKIVFFFAFIAVFLVIIFTYFFKLHTPPAIEPLPPEQVHPVSGAEWQTRILELKRTADGNTATSSIK